MVSIGNQIRQYRKKRGLTQKQLAALVLISHQQISLYEMDKSIPTADTLVLLSKALDVTPNDLVGYVTENSGLLAGCDNDELKYLERVIGFARELYRDYSA